MSQDSTPEQIFIGDSEMAKLMRSLDWSQTPLGALSGWPSSLKTAVSICLNSRFPMVIWWGKELVLLYNDAWRPILGTKHPKALGRPGQEMWAEIWDIIGVQLNSVLETAQATWSDDMLLLVDRYGYTEEAYFTYSYSPIFLDTGEVGGAFTAVTETTRRVIGQRRLRTLRELAANTVEAKSVEETCRAASATLASNPYDIPFALLYSIEQEGRQARLVGTVGVEAGTSASNELVDLTRSSDGWKLAKVKQTGNAERIDESICQFGPLPGGAWDEPSRSAIVLPIAQSGQKDLLAGLLVLGISPRREFDDEYRGFFDLVASNVATAIANADAYEAERQRAEALAELDRAKTTFFSNVSHEFRTPLTLMLNPLEDTLANPDRLLPGDREQLEIAYRNSQRLLKLVNTLLDFSRIEAGRIEAVYEPTDLAVLTADLAGVFRSAIERAGMRLQVDCPPLPAPVYVDREMWEKIVLNLLSNAFKFTFAGEIAVSLRAVGDRIELEVRDTGTGIPAEELPQIFERFHRVKGARGRSYEGSGIGLSLVQELVKLHGGTIRVNSLVDRGTCFTVAIPTGCAHLPGDRIGTTRTLASTALGANPYVAEASRWLPDEERGMGGWGDGEIGSQIVSSFSPSHPLTLSPPQILLADDNADMRDYLKRLLSQYWEVETVSDGFAALEAIARGTPDLVLSDVMMPRLDGFGLLRELRSDPITQNIPVILLSARAGEEARIEGLEAGADDYLTKPFSARELLARVESNLKLAQLRQAAAQQEQALGVEAQAAKDSLESVLTRIADQFLALDRDWRYTYVNDRVTEVTGIDREDLLGRSVWDVFPDMVGTGFDIEVHRAAAEQTPVQFEYFYPTWNRWFENHVYPSADGVSIIVTEITARKQAEEQLRESEKFLKAVNETAPNLLYIFDLNERRNVYVSPQIFPILGILPADVQEMDSQILAELFHPDDLDRIGQHHDRIRAAREDGIFTIEYRMKHSSGKWLWLSSRDTIFVRDDRGKPRQILGSAIDITDRKQAELLLGEQKRLLELIATGTPLDECLSAACYSISELSPSTRACFLLTDARGLTFSRSITPDFPPSLGRGVQDLPINDLCIGTCGEAVYRGQPIACADIANDDRWSSEWRDLCVAHGILGCHSSPVLGIERSPFGSLMLCFSEARTPTDWEYQLAAFGAQMASIAFERDRSSLALRESEELLSSTFAGVEGAITVVEVLGDGEEFRFLSANRACVEWSGVPLERWIGSRPQDIVPPEEAQAVCDRYRSALRTGQAVKYEERLTLPTREIWAYTAVTPWRDNDGRIARLVTTSIDITDRKQAEAALRESEERYRTLFESIDQGFCIIEMIFDAANRPLDYRFLITNPAFDRQTGTQNAQGKTVREIAPNHEDYWFEIYGNVALTGEAIRFENLAAEFHRWYEVHAFRTGEPELRRVGILFNDITDRKQAEEALRQSEEQIRLATTAADLGMWFWQVQPDELVWTDKCKALFGLPADAEVSYEITLNLIHPDDRAAIDEAVRRSLQEGVEYDVEYRSVWSDGSIHWIAAKGRGFYDDRGNPISMMGTVQDITDRVRIERDRERILQQEQAAREAAENANRIKDEFLAVISHELRSPLNPILGWSQLLQRGKLAPEKTKTALETIDRNARLQSQLIEDLLDISRILRGKLSLNETPVNLSTVIRDALETVRLAAEAKTIELTFEVIDPGVRSQESEVRSQESGVREYLSLSSSSPHPPISPSPHLHVMGDAGRLQQVVWNLLSNAVKFTPQGGRITVTLTQSETHAQIQVTDTGKGIKPDFLPYVFEHFRQEDGATTRKFGGLGLGLAIVRQIVEMHGGRVGVESQGEAKGATFTVLLPLASVSLAMPDTDPVSEATFDLNGIQILVVDDEPDSREFITFLLEQAGAIVTSVASGFEALQAIERSIPDSIVSDIGMPEIDGYMLMQQIRTWEQFAEVPAIALTAYAGEFDRQQALKAGFQQHLPKPVEPEVLVKAIALLIRSTQLK
ncbi:MAG: PAS domain S-box protein [Cyanosarcina radialis HA8281-LM2]|jgi:PAS domain S-box-containing protein|nr:PAS domain S-box protein [Cyanosarcina radialis HA8281-LM2]